MIGYLGPEESYSHHACSTFYVKEELVPYNNIGRLFYALEHDEVDGIVVPFENMKEGTRFDILNRIRKNHYHITREIIMDIILSLVSMGKDASQLTEVYATEHSIDECYDTLKTEIGKYQKRFVPNNKAAYRELAKSENDFTGAVLSSQDMFGEYHVVLNNIRDTKENYHKFVLIQKSLDVTGFHNRTLIACSPKFNQVGALYDIIHEFVIRGINIVKILSIPTKSQEDDIVFYIELEGNMEDRKIVDGLAIIKFKAKYLEMLGSYYAK